MTTYTFTPPSTEQRIASRGLWARYGTQVSSSLLKQNGRYTTHPMPTSEEIADLIEGIDWFLGGHVYEVDETVAGALIADGFTVDESDESPLVVGMWPGGNPGLFPTDGTAPAPITTFALVPPTSPGPDTYPTE